RVQGSADTEDMHVRIRVGLARPLALWGRISHSEPSADFPTHGIMNVVAIKHHQRTLFPRVPRGDTNDVVDLAGCFSLKLHGHGNFRFEQQAYGLWLREIDPQATFVFSLARNTRLNTLNTSFNNTSQDLSGMRVTTGRTRRGRNHQGVRARLRAPGRSHHPSQTATYPRQAGDFLSLCGYRGLPNACNLADSSLTSVLSVQNYC
ncbi:hypothetical protein IRJ41_020928, partial [Triplophysa rosa]